MRGRPTERLVIHVLQLQSRVTTALQLINHKLAPYILKAF